MSLLDKIAGLGTSPPAKPRLREVIAPPNTAPKPGQLALAPAHPDTGAVRKPVRIADLDRILALPRRAPLDDSSDRAEALVALMTERLQKPNTKCICATLDRPCITRLKPAQAWALFEIGMHGGLLGPIGVGHGKTGLDILAPMVLDNCRTVVLLVPPSVVSQLLHDYQAWSQHFRVPSIIAGKVGFIQAGNPVIHVIPYSKLSQASATTMLERLRPDTIIADEAHKLRYRDTATTSRVTRYFFEHPDTRLCCWSGTLTSKSIRDYAHLSTYALREKSPLPLSMSEVEQWSKVIDPSDWPAPMGELERLCKPGESIHTAFNRRLVESPGVVATRAGAIDAAIYFHERCPEVPESVNEMLTDLRKTWMRPDGEELVDAIAVARCARELASGFYYRWIFPRGESKELIAAWLLARKEWHQELRAKLKNRREHLDSPLLCTKAAIRWYDRDYTGDLPRWHAKTWTAWRDIRDKVQPETEAVWVDRYMIDDCAKWAKANKGIVWYEHTAFGRLLSEVSGLPLHEGGLDAEAKIRAEKGDTSIVASIKSHGTGRDGLQLLFNNQLVANPPVSASAWEQLLGRLHRIGQSEDEVNTTVYRHTQELRDAFDKTLLYARYIQGTIGSLQKLLSANVTF